MNTPATIRMLVPEAANRLFESTKMEPNLSAVEKPSFSIVLTTYNRASKVGRAITSVLQQTFSAFELLVIDDASTDTTSEVVSGFVDARLQYIRQPQNGGVGQTRNLGIERAVAEYIVFVDDDDTIAPTFLAEVYKVMLNAPSTVGFMWTWKEVVRETDHGIELLNLLTYDITSTEPQPGTKILHKLTGGSGGLVVRADSLQVSGAFNPELRGAGDVELLIRLAKFFEYIVIPQPLYQIYTLHDERLTTPSLMRAQSVERIIELHHDLLAQYPRTLRILYRACARTYYQIGKRHQGRRSMYRLIRHEPFYWSNWVLLGFFEALDYLPAKLHDRVARNHE